MGQGQKSGRVRKWVRVRSGSGLGLGLGSGVEVLPVGVEEDEEDGAGGCDAGPSVGDVIPEAHRLALVWWGWG